MKHKSKNRHKGNTSGSEALNRRLTVRFRATEKDILKEIKDNMEISYAELIREAVYAYYSAYFNRK